MLRQKSLPLILVAIALTIFLRAAVNGQSAPSFKVIKISPFDKATPGQIMELQVEGLTGVPPALMQPPTDFELVLSQDGIDRQIGARVVTGMMTREKLSDSTFGEMKPLQSVSFVVPHGLHPGTCDVVLSYKGTKGNPLPLTIVDRPLRPQIGMPPVMMLAPTTMPLRPAPTQGNNLGWRFERDSRAQFYLKPLTDPDDPTAAVMIRFKQGSAFVDAPARVIHQTQKVERRGTGTAFVPARDYLEVEISAALTMGPADMEIKIRANGAESDPVTIKVVITDTTRSAESPAVNAPRLLAVVPQKVGAGQALMLSVDYLRTLNPDPSQTLVSIERGTARYFVKPEHNSALRMPTRPPDAPVVLIARPTREIIGPVQVRVLNSLKGEQGASAPIPIEIVDDALPPKILEVRESTETDLARLREMYELKRSAGERFGAYDPKNRYLTIRGQGIDPNPRYLRIALEQNGETTTLSLSDISFSSGELLIVRLPPAAMPGTVRISIANLGAQALSAPASMTFELTSSRR